MTSKSYEQRFAAYLAAAQQAVEQEAGRRLPETSEVCRAARYSLTGGGKRIRAILVLAVSDLAGGDAAAARRLAAAVEMLHCYSLIHDDLPCMDNDDYRRGQLSCHKKFGEATALLAGDVLLTEAFEAAANASDSPRVCAAGAAALAAGAGSRGMVYGQELDLAAETEKPDAARLEQIHHYKTGSLIEGAVEMGIACGTVTPAERAALDRYAFDLGLVFQIVDDVLDVTATSAELGKPAGSDAANGKVTFATLYGPEKAMETARRINEDNCRRMNEIFGDRADFLAELAKSLLTRRN